MDNASTALYSQPGRRALMSATRTPKQGDHVVNSVETEIVQPFVTLQGLRSDHVDGRHFLYDYLMGTYTFVLNLADTGALRMARELSASAGAEDDALRALADLGRRYPSLLQINPGILRTIHSQNADHFGAAAT